jgi:hypothetical protein
MGKHGGQLLEMASLLHELLLACPIGKPVSLLRIHLAAMAPRPRLAAARNSATVRDYRSLQDCSAWLIRRDYCAHVSIFRVSGKLRRGLWSAFALFNRADLPLWALYLGFIPARGCARREGVTNSLLTTARTLEARGKKFDFLPSHLGQVYQSSANTQS